YTNQRILELKNSRNYLEKSASITNSVIINLCFIGKNVHVENSIIGPHVSIGDMTQIHRSGITNSIIQTNTKISNANIENSMMGNYVKMEGKAAEINVGDYTILSGI
ncbi:MAG: hypothetical protein K8S00_00590, partial [Bacteroidales bacterium]|nr:hypothetical protein [Bacteroidales bacterium]